MRERIAVPSLLCILCFLFAAPLYAGWQQDGIGICLTSSAQYYQQIVSDGEGGAIIAFWASEGGSKYHYVQRVNAYGEQLWGASGVKLCPSFNTNNPPIAMISDGAGGAIIAWNDSRAAEGIYAQRVDSDGNLLWNAAGVAVGTASGNQLNPAIVSDGAGGAYISWEDLRGGLRDIYAQRVDANGNTLWVANGVAVCTSANDQETPRIAADRFGAYVVWKDYRAGNYDIYAQRLYFDGGPQWTANGVVVCNATLPQEYPEIIPTGYGGIIVAWQDYRSGNPAAYIQHLNDIGSAQWLANGIPVTSMAGEKRRPRIVSDGTTAGSVVVWQHGAVNQDIYAQRFNGIGTALWTTDGVPVCTADVSQTEPRIVRDSNGNLIIAWWDGRTPYETDIYAQKLSSSGTPIWTANGLPVCSAAGTQMDPWIVTDSARGVIAVWQDSRDGNSDVYVQRIEQNGYWGYPAPDIYKVRDVPGDQGGSVTMSWYASRLDPLPDGLISSYTVWRAVDQELAQLALARGARAIESVSELDPLVSAPAIRTEVLAGQTYFWELVSTLDAFHLSTYSKTVPTLFDSTEVCGDRSYFQVIAHTSDSRVFWISQPDSARSVDNLAPAAPVGLAGVQVYTPVGLNLVWDPNVEPDLDQYLVYRGTSAGFVPGPSNLLGSTADTLLFDGGWSWSGGYYYKVAAVDIHGNVSSYALLAPETITDTETPKAPAASFLAQNFPNPFNPTTKISFGLAAPANVSLRIYDAAGRLVCVLVEDARPAGNYSELWDGRDSGGRAVASGIYFYRLTAGTFTETRKMALLR